MANNEKVEKLKMLLKELFQFENNDLDFGIYRIINIKKNEIYKFINEELFNVINEKIKTLENSSELQKRLESLRKDIEDTFGCNIEEAKQKYAETPKVKDYLSQEKEFKLADKENEIEEEIYDDIINFFSRYYDKGDFISKRRYSKDNKYAIPYNGEEVYLYWANNDQYYIKTGENFKHYSFKTRNTTVDFEIVSEEVDVEKNNIKETDKKFFIFSDVNYNDKKKELKVQFGYRGLTEEETKEILDLSGKKTISKDEVNIYNLNKINEKIGIYGLSDLQAKHEKLDGDKSDKSELEWHLNKYTTKNTSDYFIHKDLKKFLTQELDFYIKNEIFHIDDIDSREDFNANLNKVKVFKQISIKIIDFLSQVEEFQKKLWEKKKFVINTDYCITLDYIDEKYYPTILSNKKQLQEWKDLFSFDIEEKTKEFKGNLKGAGKKEDELMIELLKNNPTLVIDTKFYDIDFKYQLLSEIDNLDENTNGILINSDNFQALNLLLNKYKEKVKCCYIDPPYNTAHSEIVYKNQFKHSSWLTLLNNTILISKEFLSEESSFGFAIDDYELPNALAYLKGVFSNFDMSVIVVNHHPQGSGGKLSRTHEYYIICSPPNFSQLLGKEKEIYDEDRSFMRSGTAENNYRYGRWKSFYALLYDSKTNKIVDAEEPIPLGQNYSKEDINGLKRIYPINSRNEERVWRSSYETGKQRAINGELFLSSKGAIYQAITHESKREVLFSNWTDSKYNAGQNGSALINHLGLRNKFDYPKSIYTMETGIITQTQADKKSLILDFFAGSGTTGHAVLKLNKEDEGNRKFILVEMGQYFDTVTKPRILKVIYSDNWKDGKPQDNNGSMKQIIKYQSLEQYEDSLNNIDFKEPNTLAKESKDYKIKYMLEFESRDNNVFLNLDALDNPFDYKLKVENNNEMKEFAIDLVETFNYVAGIEVKSIKKLRDESVDYIVVKGRKEERDILIIWRNKNDKFDPVRDKEFVTKEIINEEYDEILVNGNSLIDKAKSIDEVFKTNMFRG